MQQIGGGGRSEDERQPGGQSVPAIKKCTASGVVADRPLHVPKIVPALVVNLHGAQPCVYLRVGGGGGGNVLRTRSPLSTPSRNEPLSKSPCLGSGGRGLAGSFGLGCSDGFGLSLIGPPCDVNK